MYTLTTNIQERMISTAEASTFLEINTFEGQRQLCGIKVNRYCAMMKTGEMRPIEIAVAKLEYENGRNVLMNGQHTLNAIIKNGAPHRATIQYWKCSTPQDAYKLFGSFDVHGTRTQTQIMKAAKPRLADERLHAVPTRVLNVCGSALAFLGGGMAPVFNSQSSGSKTRKPDLCDMHGDDVMFVARFAGSARLMFTGVVTAMISTHRADPIGAMEFWSRVDDGIGMQSRSDPRYALREYLNDESPRKYTGGQARNHELYYTCVMFWNSFVKGESRTRVNLSSISQSRKVVPLAKYSKDGDHLKAKYKPHRQPMQQACASASAILGQQLL